MQGSGKIALTARSGLTIPEVVIAVALLVLLLSSAILAATGGYGAFKATQSSTDLETRARRAIDRAALELLSTGEEELLPNPTGDFGTQDLLFRQAVGLNGTAVIWGDQNRLAFEYEPGEANDGIDNDGNELVDDGRLVLTRDVGGNEKRAVLCHGVRDLLEGEDGNGGDDNGNGVIDECGFNVHRIGDVLYIRLSLEEPGENGNIVRTLETSVRLRN